MPPEESADQISSSDDEDDEETHQHLMELDYAYSRHRYYGPSYRLNLIKSSIDSKQTNKGQEAIQIVKRPLFWDLQPWQLMPEPELEPLVFPPEDLFNDLVELWFAKSAPFFPLFHRPTIMKSISFGLHHHDRHFGETVLTMCASASHHSDDPRVIIHGSKLTAGFMWMRQVNPVPTSFVEPVTLPQLQKLIVYVMFMQTTSMPWPGWISTGLGLRLLQDVGAHRKNVSPPSISGELWKRAVWIMNYIDLLLALNVGRPRTITPDDYDVDFPMEVDDEYWEQPGELAFRQPTGKTCQLTYWIHMLKLVSILEGIQRAMSLMQRAPPGQKPEPRKRVIGELNKLLDDWLNALPDQLKWNPERTDTILFHQSTMLHLTYYFLRIYINWPRRASSTESLDICVSSAQLVILLMDAHRKRDYVSLGPQMLVTITNSAIILTINIWKSKRLNVNIDINAGMENVLKCMDHLEKFEDRLQVAGRYRDTVLNIIFISNLAGDYSNAKERYRNTGIDSHQTAFTMPYLALPFGQPNQIYVDPYQALAYDQSPLANSLNPQIPISDAYIEPPILSAFGSQPLDLLDAAPEGSDSGNPLPSSSVSSQRFELGIVEQQHDWTSRTVTSNADAMEISEGDWGEYMESVDEVLRALRQS